jgi:phosphate-selective porin
LELPQKTTVFSTAEFDGDWAEWIHGEIGWHWGPFRISAELVEGAVYDVQISGVGKKDFDQLDSWSAYGSWYITGQRVRRDQGHWLSPAVDAGPEEKQQVFDFLKFLDPLGCLEIAFRYVNADVDRRLFDFGFTNYEISSQEVRTATLNLNWYPTPGLKVTGAWVKTIADDYLITLGGTNRDSSFVLRAMLTF